MSYTKYTWTDGETITAPKLNHMEDGIAGAGGDYDLVIMGSLTDNLQNWSVVKGSILDAEDKLDGGDVVNAVCVFNFDWSAEPSIGNTNKIRVFMPLVSFDGPYRTMQFCAHVGSRSANNDGAYYYYATIQYDADTGAITHVYVGTNAF